MNQRIRELREDHDLSQKEIAAVLRMSQTGYSKYETGENGIPAEVLIRLAMFYGTSTDYLLGMTDQMQAYPVRPDQAARCREYRDLFLRLTQSHTSRK